jgi:hypothetical protein
MKFQTHHLEHVLLLLPLLLRRWLLSCRRQQASAAAFRRLAHALDWLTEPIWAEQLINRC